MGGSRRGWPAALLAVAVAAALPAHAQALPEEGTPLRVMTWNAGEGTDWRPLYFAVDAPSYIAGVGRVLQEVRATQPEARMRALAARIAAEAPALVSLQSLDRWSVGPVAPRSFQCGPLRVEIDMLSALTQALRRLGRPYHVAAQVPQFSLPPLLAETTPGERRCVQVLDRNVILVRTGLPPARLSWSNPQAGRLDAPAQAPAGAQAQLGVWPGGRAWASVDVRVQGRELRFIGAQLAHLDPFLPGERRIDGEVLRAIADASPWPVAIALAAHTQAAPPPPEDGYVDFLTAGYRDAWMQAQPGQPGFTCCQAPAMDNPQPQLTRRTDLVWLRGAVRARAAALAGADEGSRTAGGLWPSDHAGVSVELVLEASP